MTRLQEIIRVCINCGLTQHTGKMTPAVFPEHKYAYSHGYCSKECVRAQHGDYIASMFSEADEWAVQSKRQTRD